MVDEDAGANPFQVLAGALDDLVAVGVLSAKRRLDAGYPIRSAVRGPRSGRAVRSGPVARCLRVDGRTPRLAGAVLPRPRPCDRVPNGGNAWRVTDRAKPGSTVSPLMIIRFG